MNRKPDALSLGVFVAVLGLWNAGLALIPGRSGDEGRAREMEAARRMGAALEALREEADLRGFAPDPASDPSKSGLIGLPHSGLTTTLGSLPAKRSGAQPAAGALMVRLLNEAGLSSGDRVAIDSSASFPGFTIAAIIAAESLGAEPTTIISLGSSSWGANRPEFSLADMVFFLYCRGLIGSPLLAVTPGGADDGGSDLDQEELISALGRSAASGALLILPPELAQGFPQASLLLATDLGAAIEARKELFFRPEGGMRKESVQRKDRPRLLVEIGGNAASEGLSYELMGRTGLIRPEDLPEREKAGPGLMQAFLKEGIPVLRILDIKALSASTGLPFDPEPYPSGEAGGLPEKRPAAVRMLAGSGLILAFAAALLSRRRKRAAAP